MIFKNHLSNNTGNLVLVTAVAIAGAMVAFALLNSSLSVVKSAGKNAQTSKVMMDAHSVAGLFKVELANNYESFKTSAAWASCRSGGTTPNAFVKVLNAPGDICGAGASSINFVLTNFKDADTNLSSIKLNELIYKGPVSSPTPTTLVGISALNGFSHKINIQMFNTDTSRNQLIASLQTEGSENNKSVRQEMKMMIDVSRTVNPPTGSNTATICRSVAGAICDESSAPLLLSYLDSSGRILNVSHDESSGVTLISDPNLAVEPLAVSVKNLATTRTNYRSDSFCINAIQGSTPIMYLIDAATDSGVGDHFYLSAHGKLMNGATGAEIWVDPKITSIAFDNAKWYLLRSDGAVFRSNNIAGAVSNMQAVNGLILPTAEKLTMGPGPAPCP
jgi:hypothetical protein